MLAMTPSLPGDQVIAFILLDVAIVLVVARLVGGLALRVGQPRVVGEIVAGVLLGPSLLGPTVFTWTSPFEFLACDRSLAGTAQGSISGCLFPPQAQTGLNLLGQLALILFMFLVGMELDPAALRGKVKGIAAVAFGVVALPIAAGFLLAPLLWNERFVAAFGGAKQPSQLGFSLMVGAMLSVTAFPVAARILQEKGLDRTTFGAVGIASAAAVTILMFLAVGIARGVAVNAATSVHVWRGVGAVVYLAVALGVIRPLLARWLTAERIGSTLKGDHFAVLLIAVMVSAYAADRIGIHVIVGGFVGGLVVPRVPVVATALSQRVSEVTITFLLPIFLAYSGLRTDFTKLGLSWGWVPGLAAFVVVAIAAKWLGGLLFGRLGGLTWSESNALGILMNCRGLLVLVVALVALNAGVISAQMQVGAVVMALVTTAMTGPLVDRFLPKSTA